MKGRVNLGRGLFRLGMLVSVFYWFVAAALAHVEYRNYLSRIAGIESEYLTGSMSEEKLGVYNEAVRRGLIGAPEINIRQAYRRSAQVIINAAVVYVGLAVALGGIPWVVAGFRPKIPPST